MSAQEASSMLSAIAEFESGGSFKSPSSGVWDFQGVTIHRNGEDLVMCEIVGDIVCIRGKGFTFEQVGAESKFTQTGKIPSIRAAKVLAKSLAQFRSGA